MPEPIDLDYVRIDPDLARSVPEKLALRRGILVFARDAERAFAACRDPEDLAAIEAVERAVGAPVMALPAEPGSLDRALQRVYAKRLTAGAGDEAVRLLEELLHAAIVEQASDVHVEPERERVRIRFRVDGVLEEHRSLPLVQFSGLSNRIKVLAELDIAERRLPQDGRFTFRYGGEGEVERAVDVRVATLPGKHGERATLRLLALQTEALTLERLGMAPADLALFRRELRRPHGLILLTGPTGSGKTTTLYGALRELDVRRINVLTIEDPIEYEVAGVSQTEVDAGDRVTFASALRSVLRHDPDVLMIGEIRDQETADVAIKAALTGHLVLSTLHTNSAVSAVTRLRDMGVPAYLIAATLRLAVAQRLVRRLCLRCRGSAPLGTPAARALGSPSAAEAEVAAPGGCMYCRGSGYSGRIGLFESFWPDESIAAMVADGRPEGELAARALENGMASLRADALAKVLAGATSPAEAMYAVEVR